MYIIVKVKATDNIIGLKEEIALRLEDIVDVEFIDVTETKLGNWLGDWDTYCSVCGTIQNEFDSHHPFKYCPECGAKMNVTGG